ncbi:MAG: hypothetical protein E2P05_09360 [Acidobacteria bacterium]|nr:MAG: hypothetical protein E2P05_09360 [Acidobacteriota bacterium]
MKRQLNPRDPDLPFVDADAVSDDVHRDVYVNVIREKVADRTLSRRLPSGRNIQDEVKAKVRGVVDQQDAPDEPDNN